MTNEEIEKRFLFDLNMGVFRCINGDYPTVIRFIERKRDKSRFRLISILDNLGFERNEYHLSPRNMIIVTISTRNKKYNIRNNEYLNPDWYYNKVPDYVKRYKI